MSSTPPPNPKRASAPRASRPTKTFANDSPLAPKWLDHPLKGDWADQRECHIGGDFLLVYQLSVERRAEAVTFTRAGTHTELFE